jgi:hypothetical protein
MTLVAAILLPASGAVAGLPASVQVSVTDVYRTILPRHPQVEILNGKAWFENSGGRDRNLLCVFQGSAGRTLDWATKTIRVKVPAHSTAIVNVRMKGPAVDHVTAGDFTMWKDQCNKAPS